MTQRHAIPNPEVKPLLSAREVAALMGWGKDTVYAMIRDGSLAHIKVRKRVYVPTSALRRYVGLPEFAGSTSTTTA